MRTGTILGLAAFTVGSSLPLDGSEWYYNNWCGGDLQYLVDANCQKVFPSNSDRKWHCPVEVLNAAPIGYHPDNVLSLIDVDTTLLDSIITSSADVCVVLIKRVLDGDNNIKLYNKYYCAGDRSKSVPYQPWSR